MAKKAPVKLTGGGGFRYENAVAARFLLNLLRGANALGPDFGRIRKIDWQARDSGWLADDLAIACGTGGDRSVGISIKSDQQVTLSGFSDDFVRLVWSQWFAHETDRKLHGTKDAVALVTGSLPRGISDAWSDLLSQALITTPDRMAVRLAEPSQNEGPQSSALQRALFASLRCPEDLKHLGEVNPSDPARLLPHIRLLHFDYEKIPSHDHARALADCQSVIKSDDASEAERLWRRLNGIADENRLGGSIDLPKLLEKLCTEFDLRNHPDYRRDWEIIDRSSQELMAEVRTQIADFPPLARLDQRRDIKNRLDLCRSCLLIGESGCGKSALAKEIGTAHFRRVIWINDNTLDYDTASQFERGMGIAHPLHELLAVVPDACLVVFDGMERFSQRALRLAARIMQMVLADAGPRNVDILVTAQFESADRVIRRLVEAGVPSALHEATPVPRPSVDNIEELVVSIPGLQWASLRPGLRSLLTNLKVLDWVVTAARAGNAINPQSSFTLTNLIDALWERWVEGDDDPLGRSRVLMRLGVLEADTLTTGVPKIQMEQSEQPALQALAATDLVRIRDERVRFSHDMVGDWARMRVLLGESSLSAPANLQRAMLPRWHRAMRLFGQRLLEQSDDGCVRWQQSVEAIESDSETGAVMRDLFLESLFLATDASALLERSWAALMANQGRLLNRMLNRFLFVATLPDSRFTSLLQGEGDSAQWEHLLRVPYWPYWGPMLTVLRIHMADVVRVAPHNVAKLCALWLRTMPVELMPGHPMPWRREAAELAMAIGREVQALNAEGNYFSDGHDKYVFEAVLLASPELPDEVGALCLELAERRDLRADIRQRIDQALAKRQEERRQWLASNPGRAKPPVLLPSIHGPLRDPWPDGPRDHVVSDFQRACLDTGAFSAFAQARPDAALEVLLAVCIETPQYEDYSTRSREDCGLDHWQDGEPSIWCRGPFLQFLRHAPDQGFSFVLKLTNFATRRCTGDFGLTINIDGLARKWFGDLRVFRWHYDWPLWNGAAVHCALMALERWFYEQIERGEAIDRWVRRILSESESLAFAGLLFDVGKRSPTLFSGVLRPLLRVWQLVDWDRQVTTLRLNELSPMGYWGFQPAQIIALAREWFAMPHRRNLLTQLDGGVVQTMIGAEEHWPFFDDLRADWAGQLTPDGEPESLRLLIERFNPKNYTFEMREGKRIPVDFQWPELIARETAQDLTKLREKMTVSALPQRCRERLDSQMPLSDAEVSWLWQFLQNIDTNPPPLADEDGEALLHLEDILCGGIALFIVLHHDWLASDPDRMAWCRSKLESVIARPPNPFRFDSEMASGDRKWDLFAAEAAISLLAKDRSDPLARRMVATCVLSFHYSTTARTLYRGYQHRRRLGEDFDRMLGLAARWAGLHPPYSLATRPQIATEPDRWEARKQSLIQDFVDQVSPIAFPEIVALNSTTVDEIEVVQAAQFPSLARARRAGRPPRRRGRSRQSLYADPLRLDTRVLSSAFAWLDLGAANLSEDRKKWLNFIRMFLAVVLGTIPKVRDPRQQEIEGHPTEFDGWVLGRVSAAIPCLTAKENPASLWQPILDLGSPAHDWVERFFWYWFTDGLRATKSPADFVHLWHTMILYALDSPSWDPVINRSSDLDGMVFQLLGFDSRMNRLGLDLAYSAAVTSMEDVFARAALRWFRMPKVVNGFLHFATQPAAGGLLLPGISWLAAVVPSFDSYDWKYGLEDNLVAFLHVCWERKRQKISGDPGLQAAYLALLACVVSRGSHAAIALRDRVVDVAAS